MNSSACSAVICQPGGCEQKHDIDTIYSLVHCIYHLLPNIFIPICNHSLENWESLRV